MRKLLVVATGLGLALAGCEGEPGPQGPAGENGQPGQPGTSCTITDTATGSTITCGDVSVDVLDGATGGPGDPGDPGTGCTAVDNGPTITITCSNGTFILNDGTEGPQGPSGAQAFYVQAEMPETLSVEVTSVQIASPPVVNFSVRDAAGRGAIGLLAGTTGQLRFALAKLVPGADASSSGRWQSYLNRKTSTTPYVTMATYERSGTLVDHGDGTYTYTFATDPAAAVDPVTAAPIGYDPALTHRVAVQLSGSVGEVRVPMNNALFDFVPNGGAVTTRREIVNEASCNECHGNLTIHGSRYKTQYCVMCHNPGTVDQGTGESADLAVMIHGIHGSHVRESTAPYVIAGEDFSEVTYPQDASYCLKCHNGADAATPQGDNWKLFPNKAACGACHTAVDFASHAGNDRTADDLSCRGCHGPTSTYKPVAGVHAHENPSLNSTGYKTGVGGKKPYTITYDIEEVTVNETTRNPVVTFRIMIDTDPTDTTPAAPLDLANKPADLTNTTFASGASSAPSFLIAYATPQSGSDAPGEFNNLGNGSGSLGQPLGVSLNVLSLTDPTDTDGYLGTPDADGYYTVELKATGGGSPKPVAFPAGAVMRTVALQGYFTQYDFFKVQSASTERGTDLSRHAPSVMKTATGDSPRREVVDSAKCASCHEWFDGHGGNRVFTTAGEPLVCTMCHVPNLTTSGRVTDPGAVNGFTLAERLGPEAVAALTANGYDAADPLTWPEGSNNLKDMIHGIHASHVRSTDYDFVRDRTTPTGTSVPIVFYYNWNEVTFPANVGKCETCHEPDTYLSVPASSLPTTWQIPDDDPATHLGTSTTERGDILALRKSAPNATDLVSTPVASTCSMCHDTVLAEVHMEQNGGMLRAPRSAVEGSYFETCELCHGAGRVADIAILHE